MSASSVASDPTDALTGGNVCVPSALIDELVSVVLEGYRTTLHGGLEVGGVLFGRREAGMVIVEKFRPLLCEHLLGPRFVLSDSDEGRLRELLLTASTEFGTVQGLEAVGWYCSHTRSDLLLCDREVVLHNRYFPGADDFVLIFKPRDMYNVDAHIFCRDSDGNIGPLGIPLALDQPHVRTEPVADGAAPVSAPNLPPEPILGPEPFLAPEPIQAVRQESRPRIAIPAKWKRLLVGAGVGSVACVSVWQFVDLTSAKGAPSKTNAGDLVLSLRPQAENLMLSWKSNVTNARRAHVDIFDGPSLKNLDISESFQPTGMLLFPHTTGNVQAVLTLELKDRAIVRRTGFTDSSTAIKDVDFTSSPPKVSEVPQQPSLRSRHGRHKRRR